jgi:Transglutaminase-like superfamily
MKRLFKSGHITSYQTKVGNRYLLLKTFVLLNSIRLGLCFLPFQRLLNLVVSNEPTHAPRPRPSIGKIVWMLDVATRYSPGGAKCLARALTAKMVLAQFGYAPDLKIGVAKKQGRGLEAHAWLEYRGRVIVGQLNDLSRFIPLPSLEGISL